MKYLIPWVVIGALTVAVISVFALPVSAQVTELNVRVDGLSCPFCAYSLEKKLKDVAGVKELSINVSEGVATMTPEPGERIDIAGIPEVVESAGFTPRDIKVHARGLVRTTPDGAALIALDGQTLFLLEPNDLLDATNAKEDTTYEVQGTVALEGSSEHETETLSLLLVSATPLTGKEGT